jgi:hypothetical protein
MKFTDVIRNFGALGYFELPRFLELTQTTRPAALVTLHRWRKQGKIVQLRRGLYALPEDIAKNPLTIERAANEVYKESYVTGLWRLNQLGLIPEGVVEITNATTKNPAEFDTPLGRYIYRHIGPAGFFGFETLPDGDAATIRVATPEKALLDFFWWKAVEWTEIEFARWRIQDPFGKLNFARLKKFAKQWDQPRLIRAADRVTEYLAAA